MALTRDQIDDLAEDGVFLGNVYEIARAIEAEVRKQDDALIRQMLEVLEESSPLLNIAYEWKSTKWTEKRAAAITAAQARLGEMPA